MLFNGEIRGLLERARRGRLAGQRASCAGLFALYLGTGCVSGWGDDFYSKGVAPSKAPLSVLVVEGEGAPSAKLSASIRAFVGKEARIGIRTLTPAERAAAKPVTGSAAACALGKSVGEQVVVWSAVRRRSEPAFKCLKTEVEMTPRGEVHETCIERSGEPSGVFAHIAVEVRVVDTRVEQCLEIALERAEQRAEADTEEAAAIEAERLAWIDLEPKLERAFLFDPTVTEAGGDWGEIDPGREGALKRGDLYNVVRRGSHVGTAAITRAGEGGTEARLLRGRARMMPGDILVSTNPSASCCLELRPFLSGAAITTPAGDPRFAGGGGLHIEWYQPVRSLLFGLSMEKLVTSGSATTDFFTAHAGYQWMLWPRGFGIFGRVGGGFSTSHLHFTLDGEGATADASGGHVSGMLGVKLGLFDAAWLIAEGGYSIASEHDGWSAEDAEGEDLELPFSIPESSNVNSSGPLFRVGLVVRFWPY